MKLLVRNAGYGLSAQHGIWNGRSPRAPMREFGAGERHHVAKEAVEEETWSRWRAGIQYNDLQALSRFWGRHCLFNI
ncbi:hypothetical protein GCM10025858_30400 [Alicyclobacillus sacchari]|nr:hypothetical protein GCM10025858_30400 [Alicyclobacillus sacchari]